MESKKENTCGVKYLIVDSAGFIKNALLKDLGEEIYTIEQVVTEIRDRATRSRLQVLPYTLNFKTPSAESIKFVTDFSKKTGDYASLSSVDLKVIALTFQIHKEHGDASEIKSEPNKNVLIESGPKHIPVPKGFYFEKKYINKNDGDDNKDDDKKDNDNEEDKLTKDLGTKCLVNGDDGDSLRDDEDDSLSENGDGIEENSGDNDDAKVVEDYSEDEWFSSEDVTSSIISEKNNTNPGDKDVCDDIKDEESSLGPLSNDEDKENESCEDDDDEEENDGDDEEIDGDENDNDEMADEGWITPKNIASFKKSLPNQPPSDPVQVACLTTDFAMQNVLIQMGLNIVSLSGMLIKHTRSYVLKCSACFKVTKEISKVFCHHCGNQTLKKVSMTVNADGSVVYHVSINRRPNTRGLRYALPTPKGGNQAHNPILSSDQLSSRRTRRKQQDLLHPDFIARDQPFSMHALNAKGSGQTVKKWDVQPGIGKRKNPNENGRYKGKKK